LNHAAKSVGHTYLIRCCRLRSCRARLVQFTYLFTFRISAIRKAHIACVRHGKYKQYFRREIWKMSMTKVGRCYYKLMLNKRRMRAYTGFMWLRPGIYGENFWIL